MDSNDNDTLTGWKAIAEALGTSVSTARRWAIYHGMPAHRLIHTVRASRAELAAWERKMQTKVGRPPADQEKGE